MSKKDPKSPATTSMAYDVMEPRWAKINCLLGGTEAMRAAGREYLPQHYAESDHAYQERLSRTVLLNMTEMTLTSLVARPFGAPIKVDERVPKEIREHLDDVDMQGTSLDRFARNWFREGVAKAFSAVLVEFPRTKRGEGEPPRTHADDLNEGVRPYLVHIKPENIIGGFAEMVQGREVLQQIRIRENVIERDGYAEVLKERIRVLEPGRGWVFEKRQEGNSRKVKWVLIDSYTYDLDFIPMRIFYADREGFLLGKPPLTDLADLNIQHWQSKSDQISVLTVARFPMLAVSGAIDANDVVVGPNALLTITEPTGRYYYVEHSGKAIAAGRQDLLDLEEVMAEYGASFLKKRPGGATATARALDSVEITSALQDMALGFQDALNEVMWIFAQWMGIELPAGQLFKVKTDFGLSDKAEAGLQALIEGRKLGDLSHKQFILGLIRYGVLPEDFPIEENERAVMEERQEMQAREDSVARLAARAQAAAAPPGA